MTHINFRALYINQVSGFSNSNIFMIWRKKVKRRPNVSGIKMKKEIIILSESSIFSFLFSHGGNRFIEAALSTPVHYLCLCDTEY